MDGLIEKRLLRGRIYYETTSGVIALLQCTKCLKIKEKSCFRKESKSVGQVRSNCKECNKREYEKDREHHKTRSAQYRKKNHEKCRETDRLYRERNRESRRDYSFNWNRTNKNYHVTYWKENRDKARVNKLRRRAREANLPDELTSVDYSKIMRKFNDSCALTGCTEDIHMDHVIPLSTGHGGSVYGNILPLRSDINISKSNRNIFDWYEDNGNRFGICPNLFRDAIEYLAELNEMSYGEYREFVYECHENPNDKLTEVL